MTLAILTLLGALVPFGIWLWKRRTALEEDPQQQHRHAYDSADHPKPKPNADLSDTLDRLDELHRVRGGADRE